MRKKILLLTIIFVLSLNVFNNSSQPIMDKLVIKGEDEAKISISTIIIPQSSTTDTPIHIDGNSGWVDFKDAGIAPGRELIPIPIL